MYDKCCRHSKEPEKQSDGVSLDFHQIVFIREYTPCTREILVGDATPNRETIVGADLEKALSVHDEPFAGHVTEWFNL